MSIPSRASLRSELTEFPEILRFAREGLAPRASKTVMTTNGPDAYPGARREIIRSALKAAFDSSPIDAITPITGGASGASTFRVEVRGRRYILRLEGAPSPLRNPHQYVSMRIAADAGIAPTIRYVDETTRVAVIDFVEGQPLAEFPGGLPALAQALGLLLRRVQATPQFPRFVDYPDIVGRLWAYVCRIGLFAPGVLDAHTEHLLRIRETYVWDSTDSVSSHNDAIPSNILFDGRRLWLIDWESAYRNDPLVDVATMLDSLAPSPELESVLLGAWLGHAADESLLARLALIRALTRLYYAGVFLSASSAASPRAMPDGDLSAPTLPEFRRAILGGRHKAGAPETKHILGKMFLAPFIANATPPGFDAAV
jgi:aminoglycoside phosphotransferase (APT) family kinase protein